MNSDMTPSDVSSISVWIHGLRQQESEAAQKIWDEYADKLIRFAQQRLGRRSGAVLDPEDVVASVFESVWRAANAGRFDRVETRDELWWFLLALTRRKAVDHIRREGAEKRGGKVNLRSLDGVDGEAVYRELVDVDPGPEYFVMLDEEFTRLLGLLRDQQMRQIAVLRLEGHSNDEIGHRLEIAPATVTRKLRLIRGVWGKELDES